MALLPRQILNKKTIIALLIIAIASVVVVAVVSRGENIDARPEGDGIILDYSSSASLLNAEDLLNAVGNIEAYDRIREDIYAFGKNTYEPYRTSSTQVVGFSVTDKSVVKDDDKISFEGIFGSSPNKIRIDVMLLNATRIQTSITDTATNTNIDSILPSNNKLDQFIGGLPYFSDNYSIAYSEKKSKIVVRLTEPSKVLQKEALNYVSDALGIDYINDEKIDIFYPVVDSLSGRSDIVQGYIIESTSENIIHSED